MSDFKRTYIESTTLWRLRHPDGRLARALIVPRWTDASGVWFINELSEDTKDFENWDTAVKWVEEVRTTLEANGWLE